MYVLVYVYIGVRVCSSTRGNVGERERSRRCFWAWPTALAETRTDDARKRR